MSQVFYEAVVVDSAPDPDLPGFIKVRIPDLFGTNDYPIPIGPLYPGWTAGGWQAVPGVALPDSETDEDIVRVVVVEMGHNSFRYIGTTQGWADIEALPGTACGVRSPDGNQWIKLDNAKGMTFLVSSSDDVDGPKNFVMIGVDGSIMVGTNSGSTFLLKDGVASLQNSVGDSVILDQDNGIAVAHHGGTDMVTIADGKVKVLGGDVLVQGASVMLVGSVVLSSDGVSPAQPLLLTTDFMTDLLTVLADVVAIGTAIPTMTAYVASNATAMISSIGSGKYNSGTASTT